MLTVLRSVWLTLNKRQLRCSVVPVIPLIINKNHVYSWSSFENHVSYANGLFFLVEMMSAFNKPRSI